MNWRIAHASTHSGTNSATMMTLIFSMMPESLLWLGPWMFLWTAVQMQAKIVVRQLHTILLKVLHEWTSLQTDGVGLPVTRRVELVNNSWGWLATGNPRPLRGKFEFTKK